jgi:hypothetical protein
MWITLFLGKLNTGTWPSRLSRLKPEKDCTGEHRIKYELQTFPLVRNAAPHQISSKCLKTILKN